MRTLANEVSSVFVIKGVNCFEDFQKNCHMTQHVTFRWDDEVFFRSNLFTNVLFFLRLKPIHPGFKLPVSEKKSGTSYDASRRMCKIFLKHDLTDLPFVNSYPVISVEPLPSGSQSVIPACALRGLVRMS